MLAEIGPIEVLLITLVLLALFAWTLATAAARGRWGWFFVILLVPVLGTLLFWLADPPRVHKGPRHA